VHVSGHVDSLSLPWSFDLRVRVARGAQPPGAVGTIGVQGKNARYIELGRNVYIEGQPEFWNVGEKLSAAELVMIRGKYVDCTRCGVTHRAGSGSTSTSGPISPPVLRIVGSLQGSGRGQGHQGCPRHDPRHPGDIPAPGSDPPGNTLWVALRGEPYPLRFAYADGVGRLDYAEHGSPVEIRRPPAERVVTIDALDAAAPTPTPGTGPLDGEETVQLHQTVRLPGGVQVTFVDLGDVPRLKISDCSGSITTNMDEGWSASSCGTEVEVVAVDRGGSGRSPSIRIIHRRAR